MYLSGLLLWNQNRQQWIGNKKADNHKMNIREPKIRQVTVAILFVELWYMVLVSICFIISLTTFWGCSWNSTYESLLLNNKPFRQPIPLSVCHELSYQDVWFYHWYSQTSLSNTPILSLFQEMIEFLVDVWEQEGMYD